MSTGDNSMRPLQFGVTCYEQGLVEPGYILFAPAGGSECYLLGERGDIAHQWRLPGKLGNYGKLLENGILGKFSCGHTLGPFRPFGGIGELPGCIKQSYAAADPSYNFVYVHLI